MITGIQSPWVPQSQRTHGGRYVTTGGARDVSVADTDAGLALGFVSRADGPRHRSGLATRSSEGMALLRAPAGPGLSRAALLRESVWGDSGNRHLRTGRGGEVHAGHGLRPDAWLRGVRGGCGVRPRPTDHPRTVVTPSGPAPAARRRGAFLELSETLAAQAAERRDQESRWTSTGSSPAPSPVRLAQRGRSCCGERQPGGHWDFEPGDDATRPRCARGSTGRGTVGGPRSSRTTPRSSWQHGASTGCT